MSNHVIQITSQDVITPAIKTAILEMLLMEVPGHADDRIASGSSANHELVSYTSDVMVIKPIGDSVDGFKLKLRNPTAGGAQTDEVIVLMQAADPTVAAIIVIQGYASANDASAMTIEEINATGVTNVIAANLDQYKVMVAIVNSTSVGTAQKIQNLIDDGNEIEASKYIALTYALPSDASAMTIEELYATGSTGVEPNNLDAYKVAVAAKTANQIDSRAEVQTMIDAVNAEQNVAQAEIDAVLLKINTAIGTDASNITMADFETLGLTLIPENIDTYRLYIQHKYGTFTSISVVQSDMIYANDTVESFVILEDAAATNDGTNVTVAIIKDACFPDQLSIYFSNELAYKTAIMNTAPSGVQTQAQIRAIVDAVNAA